MSPTNTAPLGRAVPSACLHPTPEERLRHKHRVLEPLCSPAPHSHSFPWVQPLQLPTLLFLPSHPPVPNRPGVSQTHPRLTPAAQSSAGQSSPWPPCPTWTRQMPRPSPAPSLPGEVETWWSGLWRLPTPTYLVVFWEEGILSLGL